MNPVKIAAIVLVISAGLIGSYFIIKNPVPASLPNETNDVSALKPLVQNPLKWVENTVKSLTDNSPVEGGTNTKTENKNTTNLTELVAKTMFGQMKILDQGEKNPFQGQGFDSNDPQSQQLIQEALVNIQDPAALFNPSVENKDLKISTDNSLEAKVQYLKIIGDISRKHLGNSDYQRSAEQIIQEAEQDCLSYRSDSINLRLAASYKNTAQDYLGTSVSSDWTALHKQMITYFKKGNLIYETLGYCSEDPIKGYLAAQELPQFISGAQIIQEALNKKAAEVGL
ncbi:hypothetical protein COW77_02200 [Candidatus Wolfebacteria bacterium CG18_big_fil_WC_8_21_14_2_50_39_7]|uniref:Uncharacterized protein n=3 Tax=Candidatus Wolfeibacteriota TaxID=1752735 RepID=A0A2M7Q652_9BACT|nr:hypothetical protein [Parcubacteria group bacterium]NCO89663.1 hypothetical protein [Candidatus Wolfebacteria bacterium]OIO65221.1 MAG: hypothetical protein AUJ30_01350 [Candidatus Wolfebacteria bacterium CG1_02_39_135]PIP92034.1 MAG: hypothetical protein COW77_02200 [Candidatus Wolfebacteria bacterium CG18_big_fil_WC_8_21_14_2_50_39_7]PIY58863.1 MAG: hypothetical protein COY97_01945 [Candidatus Wolfebacteria bacterium CG_4_10_14_0_8_um_filter_39_64]